MYSYIGKEYTIYSVYNRIIPSCCILNVAIILLYSREMQHIPQRLKGECVQSTAATTAPHVLCSWSPVHAHDSID